MSGELFRMDSPSPRPSAVETPISFSTVGSLVWFRTDLPGLEYDVDATELVRSSASSFLANGLRPSEPLFPIGGDTLWTPFPVSLGFADRLVAGTALFPLGLYRLRFLWIMDICSSSEEGKSYTLASVMGFGCVTPRAVVVSAGPDSCLSPFLSRCNLV